MTDGTDTSGGNPWDAMRASDPSAVVEDARQDWDGFLGRQRFRPFLQSWTMGSVYEDMGQSIVRIIVRDTPESPVKAICFGHIVPARRGKHLAVPYGPIVSDDSLLPGIMNTLSAAAREHGCSFIRMSPFRSGNDRLSLSCKTRPSPMHMLAEHIWYLPLQNPDPWMEPAGGGLRGEEEIFMQLRKTTRNLVRRAEKEGVTIEASADPVRDLEHFITLHDETRKRHSFVPYTNAFFRAQVARFHKERMVTLYLARHQGNVVAASIHMHCFGETSYHHGASTQKFGNVPASYLLQWTAIKDALKRGDRIYNFWGIAPVSYEPPAMSSEHEKTHSSKLIAQSSNHPFAGVTTFKTGFGGQLLNLTHCIDVPLSPAYHATRLIETVRKWKRGF